MEKTENEIEVLFYQIYDTLSKEKAKKIALILVNGLIFFLLIIFFTFIHEFGHYLSALLLFKNVDFFIHPLGFAISVSDPIVDNPNAYRLFAVSGSLFVLPFTLILLYYGKKKRILGIYLTSWIWILFEELNWGISSIIKYGDGYVLLKYTPDLNSELFILGFFWIFIVSFILFLLDFHNYVKKGLINLEK